MPEAEPTAPPEPQLQPPGAGLPAVELFIARLGFRLGTPLVSRSRASKWFRSSADQMLAVARSLAPERATTRVLIQRTAGLEDSSRYWSVCMTLEHLVVVNEGIASVIESLVAGRPFPQAVSIAAVKPHPETGVAIIDTFEAGAKAYLERVAALPDLRTKLTHGHPWFGELTGLGWHRLAALHHNIHRKQIARIVRGLNGGS